MTQGEQLASVSRASGFVPTFISGRLQLPAGVADDDLLLAINGTVAGTGFVIRDGDTSGEIRGLLAEDLVQEGANEVAILVPSPGGQGWLVGGAADLIVDYVAEDGRQLELQPEGDKRLEISAVRETDGGWLVRGWAADVKEKLTADRIYVFAGDRLLVSSPPNLDNKDVARWFKSDRLAPLRIHLRHPGCRCARWHGPPDRHRRVRRLCDREPGHPSSIGWLPGIELEEDPGALAQRLLTDDVEHACEHGAELSFVASTMKLRGQLVPGELGHHLVVR